MPAMASVVDRWRRWTGRRLVGLALAAAGCALAAASASLWMLGTAGTVPGLARSGRDLVTQGFAWFVAAPAVGLFWIGWCGAAGALLDPKGSARSLAIAGFASMFVSAFFAPFLAFLAAAPGLLAGVAAMAAARPSASTAS